MKKHPVAALALCCLFFNSLLPFAVNASQDPSKSQPTSQAQTATAHITGRVYTEDGSPVSGIEMTAYDYFDPTITTFTDANGYYDLSVTAQLWAISPDSTTLLNMGLVSSFLRSFNVADNTTTAGADFLVRNITGQISGRVHDTNDQGLPFINVWAEARIDGFNYEAIVSTDSLGHYEADVCNGSWDVSTDPLEGWGFITPSSQQTTVLNSTNTLDFLAIPEPPLQITTTQIPNALVGKSYNFQIEAIGGAPPYDCTIFSGSLPSGLFMGHQGMVTGTPIEATNATFTVSVYDYISTVYKTFSLTSFNPFTLTFTNKINLQLTGETNRSYILEYTSQLPGINWTPISTNQSENGTVIFTNCISADSQRFYRARQN